MRLPSVLLLIALGCLAAGAEDWPRFRGPNGSGVSEATGLPVEFGPARNLLWKTPVPAGHSSPVLAGDRVLLTACEQDRLITLCLDRDTGRVLWRAAVTRGRSEHHHANNGPATPSPVTDGRSVYAFFPDFGLISYTLDGREMWRLPLGPFRNYKGMGSSPILARESLVLVCDQDVGSFMLSVAKDTGAIRWRKDRSEIPGNGHSTPVVYQDAAGANLAVLGATELAGYRLETGEKVWWVTGLPIQPKSSPVVAVAPDGRVTVYVSVAGADEGANPETMPFSRLLSSLDANKDGRITREEMGSYIQGDRDGDGVLTEKEYDAFMAGGAAVNALFAVRTEGRGGLTGTGGVWRYRKGLPLGPSPVLSRNVLYLVKEGGIVTALDSGTGDVVGRARLHGALDNYFASPVVADGKLYLASLSGKVSVLRADRNLELLAVNSLDDECFATPAVGPGRLYVRTRSALYCFGERRP